MLRHLQKTLRQPQYPFLSINSVSRTSHLTLIHDRTIRMSSLEEPTAEDAKLLFEKIEQKFPSKTLGGERWYLVAVIFPSLLTHNKP